MIPASDIQIHEDGRDVTVMLYARTRERAIGVATHVEDAPPIGYYLRSFRVVRRQKGGKLRTLFLRFQHTGNVREEAAPITDPAEWAEILEDEEALAMGPEAK